LSLNKLFKNLSNWHNRPKQPQMVNGAYSHCRKYDLVKEMAVYAGKSKEDTHNSSCSLNFPVTD